MKWPMNVSSKGLIYWNGSGRCVCLIISWKGGKLSYTSMHLSELFIYFVICLHNRRCLKNYNIPYRRQLDASHGPARPWQQRPGEGPRSEVWQAEEGPRHRWPTSKKDIWNAITLKIFRSEAHCIVIHELILDMINSLKTWTFKNVCFVDTKQRKLFLKGWGYSRRRW